MIRRQTGIHPAVRAFIELPEGALVWTRDPDDGTFYLAEICGPWTYYDDLEATAADLHNVRPVRMVACPVPTQVPVPVANAFIGYWTLQLIHNSMTTLRSAAVFAGLSLDAEQSMDALLTQPALDQSAAALTPARHDAADRQAHGKGPGLLPAERGTGARPADSDGNSS